MRFWNVYRPNKSRRAWFAVALGCTSAAVAYAASFALPMLKGSPVFLFFMVAMVGSTWCCGRISGSITFLLGGLVTARHLRNAAASLPANLRHELFLRFLVFTVASWFIIELVARLKSATARGNLEQRKTLGDTVQRTENQGLQLNRLQMLGRSALCVAHDCNNLLTVISGCVEQLLADLPVSSRARDHAAKIQVATSSAALITRQLLAFSEARHHRRELIEVNQVVQQMEPMLRSLLGDRIELRVSPGAHPILISSSTGRLQQMILNLAVNSRYAMPGGGILKIETAAVERLPSGIGCGRRVELLLRVCDNGIGMDEVTRAHLFEPFFTTREPGKGTGLGLAIVKQVVEENEGAIEVHSRPGAGTCFEIFFPLAAAAESEKRMCGHDVRRLSSSGATIMLVEDAAALRELTREFLLTRGYRVLDAALGSEALELATQYKGSIEVLVTDLIMPGLNGFQVADRMRACRPALKIVYASGLIPEPLIRQRAAGTTFLEKPYTLQSLEQVLLELLAGPGLAMSA